MTKPFVFIGSSAEGLNVAKAVQANLSHVCECQIWSQGLFGLSEGTLETLVKSLTQFDFAILALTNDDLVHSRGQEYNSPRDNVLFELGLFIGGIGRERTFIIVDNDKSSKLKLPSDLAGITPAFFDPPIKGNLQSAVGKACYEIEIQIEGRGIKPDISSISLENKVELEKTKASILNYLQAINRTKISFDRLSSMNSKFTKQHIEQLLNEFPDIFRIALLKGNKPGIALM